MSGAAFRTLLVLILACLLGDIVFTNGFMLLRLPPAGAGVPINELLLAVALLALSASRQPLGGFAAEPVLLPLLVLWLVALPHLVHGALTEGLWAVRDAAHMMETGFLFIGYVLASDPRFGPILHRWLGITLPLAALHLLLFPFQPQLAAATPAIASMSGYEASMLFSYGNPGSAGLTAVAWLLVAAGRLRWLRGLLAAGVITILVVFVQARVVYLQIPAALLLVAWFRPRAASGLGVSMVAALLLVLLYPASGLDLPGRLGRSFTLDFLASHLSAIWGGGGEATAAAAAGVGLRLGWWADIHARLDDPLRLLFGTGFGRPLTGFLGPAGDIVREPHNSLVSVYGRLGLVGATAFLALQMMIFRRAHAAIAAARRQGLQQRSDAAVILLCFLAMQMIFSMVEGGLEVSYVAVPYYFMAGVGLAWSRRIAPARSRLQDEPATTAGRAAATRGR